MADREVDKKYQNMRHRHGQSHASANGYVGQWFFKREQRFLLSRIKAGAILDIACGSGLMLKPMGSFVGVDFNHEACRQADSNGVEIIRGDAFNLPFDSESFDSAINCQFLNQQNHEQAERFIAEIARVLKPEAELHLMWRGAETLIHRSVNWLSQGFNKIRGLENFPQFLHHVEVLTELGERHGLTVTSEAMTLPIGQPTVQPRSLLAHLFGASHYLCFRKLPS